MLATCVGVVVSVAYESTERCDWLQIFMRLWFAWNNFRLMNIFQHVQSRWKNFEILSGGWKNFISVSDVVTCEIKRWKICKTILKEFYFTCNHGISHPILPAILSRLFNLILSSHYIPLGIKRSYVVSTRKPKDVRTKAMTCNDFRDRYQPNNPQSLWILLSWPIWFVVCKWKKSVWF